MSMVGTRVSGRDHDRRCRDRVGARARALISRHLAIDVVDGLRSAKAAPDNEELGPEPCQGFVMVRFFP